MSDQVIATDAAFDRAEKEIRDLGQAVVDRITVEYRARRIGKQGVQQRVRLAIDQIRSLPADDVPEAMCRLLEQTLRTTIVDGLNAAGIAIPELPT